VAYYAWPRFVSLEAMEIVWETVEFVGNTVIFFLAGLLFADTVLDSLGIIHLSDFGYLVLVYLALLVIRSLMLAILWIPLNKVGSPVDPREAIAMIWSGLRGAVSLTLAIIIDEEPLVSREMGARIMFHVGGIAALTLLINATTAAPLLRALGLARSSRADEKKLAVLSKHLAEHTAHAVAA
ncbi:NHX7, partial [Symbiodinium sp. CCMP2456]